MGLTSGYIPHTTFRDRQSALIKMFGGFKVKTHLSKNHRNG